jgi:SAM-dependent methyltransferase
MNEPLRDGAAEQRIPHAPTDVEAAVLQRYGRAATEVEACLCLPVSYDCNLLKVIPDEIIEKDYGCGDPSRHVRADETVLDLGSGSGKACYIMAQIVGAEGRVIGVDFNPPMLDLARKHQKPIGEKLGFHNVEFCRRPIWIWSSATWPQIPSLLLAIWRVLSSSKKKSDANSPSSRTIPST